MAKGITRSDLLRSLADDLLRLADACEQPSRSVHRAGLLIADGERIARGVWAVFRGRAPLRAIE